MLFFFFQAEDGIRDGHVTGVQTCALPISVAPPTPGPRPPCWEWPRPGRVSSASTASPPTRWPPVRSTPTSWARSEERRVGKECRCRRWGYDCGKKRATKKGKNEEEANEEM